MKKLLLLSLGVAVAVGSFAKTRHVTRHVAKPGSITATAPNHLAARTTDVTDTLSNISANDTLALYYADTSSAGGFATGTDEYGDMGFAERYDIDGSTASVQVVGVVALFGGTVNAASTKEVNFKVWTPGAPVESPLFGDPNVLESGLPSVALDSLLVPITNIGIAPNTNTAHIFANQTSSISSSFFVGYEISYDYTALAGDTIGLITSSQGERTSPTFIVSGNDTLLNNQNVTEFGDGSGWYDNVYENLGYYYDLAIFPIVIVGQPTSVAAVTKNNLTFYGNYPNPAVNSTNIKFSLVKTDDVTIQITDITGRVINTIKQSNLGAGEHIIPVETASLASGNYLYIIRTGSGAGIASKFTVAK